MVSVSAEALELHRHAVVADTHNDLLCAVVARPVPHWGRFFRERWLPQLRAGGVKVQVLPVFVGDSYRPEGALRRTLRMIECAHVIAAECPEDVRLCRDGREVEVALAEGRIALVLALESAPGIGEDVELFRTLHRLGVSIASIAHFGRTALADGSAEDGTRSRLTTAGVEALALMEAMGMIFDVSHLGASGVDHVLELARRPVMATHSCARSLRDHHRNLSDEHLSGIAATGGVICVNFYAPFLHETDHVVDRLVDHIEHIAALTGIAHVGLGPDFVDEVLRDITPPCSAGERAPGIDVTDAYLPGLEGPAGLPLVTQALMDRGWKDEDIHAVLGGNVLALMSTGLGVPR